MPWYMVSALLINYTLLASAKKKSLWNFSQSKATSLTKNPFEYTDTDLFKGLLEKTRYFPGIVKAIDRTAVITTHRLRPVLTLVGRSQWQWSSKTCDGKTAISFTFLIESTRNCRQAKCVYLSIFIVSRIDEKCHKNSGLLDIGLTLSWVSVNEGPVWHPLAQAPQVFVNLPHLE